MVERQLPDCVQSPRPNPMMTISNPLLLNNPLKPLNDLIESLNPVFTLLASGMRFAIHHPIMTVVILFVTLFLLTGLVQKVMEWSRQFWDYFFIYSAKSVELIIKGLWKLIVFLFRLAIQKREPNPTHF